MGFLIRYCCASNENYETFVKVTAGIACGGALFGTIFLTIATIIR